MCEHVFSGGCARRGGGGWECGLCRGYWRIFGFHICNHSLYHVFIIAPLYLVVDDVLLSLSDLFDFMFWYIFFIYLFMQFVA